MAEDNKDDMKKWSKEQLMSFVEEMEFALEAKDYYIEELLRENTSLVSAKQLEKSAMCPQHAPDVDVIEDDAIDALEIKGKFTWMNTSRLFFYVFQS